MNINRLRWRIGYTIQSAGAHSENVEPAILDRQGQFIAAYF